MLEFTHGNATQHFLDAAQHFPQLNFPIHLHAWQALGRYQDAIADCQAAIANDPSEAAAWFNLGNVQAKVKDYSSAFDSYKNAALLAPGVAGYRLRTATMLFQLGSLDDAEKVMKALVRKYPNYAEAYAALAALHWKRGETAKAEDDFSHAVAVEASFNNAR